MIIKNFEEQVERFFDKVAVKAGNKSLTYGDLDRDANRVANEIITGDNKKEDAEQGVALLFEHGIDMIVGLIGTLKADRIYVPFDVTYPVKRLAYMFENSGSSLILTNNQYVPLAEQLAGQVQHSLRIINIDSLSSESPGINRKREASGDRPAYILYTSGSTGRPKGVMQTHRNVLYYIRNWVQRFSITGQDRMTLFSAFTHDGAGQDIFAALLSGACLYPYSLKIDSNTLGINDLLKEEAITIWHSVPSLFRFFTGTLTGKDCFNDIRWVLLGGEPLRPHDLELFKTYFPNATLANVYGQTESSVSSICMISRQDTFDDLSIGEPLDETEIFLVNKNGDIVEEMGVGEIVVASDYIAPGYWRDEKSSEEVFIFDDELGSLYLTGDLGRLKGPGTIKMMGRKDHQVKIRGFRVETGEIETCLLKMEDVWEAVVILKETGSADVYLCAYIVAGKKMKATELREFLSRELPDYMIPMSFVQLESIPFTQSGKVDRRALEKMEKEPLELNVAYEVPQTDIEKIVADTWKEVLGLERVGINDNLFDLGGNSFDIVNINNKLTKLLNRDIPIVKIFEYTTIGDLARYLDQQEGDKNTGKDRQVAGKKREKREISEKIAVIGMAGRFPGAKNIDEFWENLINGRESIAFFSDEELIELGIPAELVGNPNYVKAKGLLEDIDSFDASFFDFTVREAEIMDPQVRIFLECAWEALENAGYTSSNYDGTIGVYAGNMPNPHWMAITISNQGDHSGLEHGFVSGHFTTYVSYKLNLTGPCTLTRTACSTSLVTIHLACGGLLLYECDMALAGGVSLSMPVKAGYLYREGMILSADGCVRAFDANSTGTVFGDGMGCVVLKRLDDAREDRDNIYAVIRGSAINNDGMRRVGFTAPSVTGQREVIRTAQMTAGVEPESISFIETHGTATRLGDAVEIEALKSLFPGKDRKYCALASVKSNVGHLNGAAGVTGFIKTVLSLSHRMIPPSLHFEIPNPQIDLENSPFYVNTRLTEWKDNGYPLRAGVSSFGLGGTNAHVVLEEWREGREQGAEDRQYHLLVLSAKTPSALDKMTANLANHLKVNFISPISPISPTNHHLAPIAYTLQVGRQTFPHRRMVVCRDVNEAVEALSSTGNGKIRTSYANEEDKPVIFMFSGLGSQYVNMGLDLYRTEPIFREEMDRCFEILRSMPGYDIKEILYPAIESAKDETVTSAGSDIMNRIDIAQVTVFTIEYALAKLILKWGIKPWGMIGYSFGEYTAACLSGVVSLEDTLTLIVTRGRLIAGLSPGSMLSVPLPAEEVKPLLKENLSIAIDNGPSCIVSGSADMVDALENQLKGKRYLCMKLPNSHAIHSTLMEPISKEFEKHLGRVKLNQPQIPYISNVTGTWITDAEVTDPAYWARHLKETVQFARGIKELTKKENAVFIEIGPGRDLIALMGRYIHEHADQRLFNLVRPADKKVSDVYYLLNKIGRLWLCGKRIDWPEFYPGETRLRIPLPTYPFEEQRFRKTGGLSGIGLIGANSVNNAAIMEKDSRVYKKPDISDWFYLPSWKRLPLSAYKPGETTIQSCWLVFIDDRGLGSRLVDTLKKKGQKVVSVKVGNRFQKENYQEFTLNPQKGHDDDYDALFDELGRDELIPHKIVHLWNITAGAFKEPVIERVDKAQDLGFYSLINIARAIGRKDLNKKIEITVVTNNMQEVHGDDGLYPEKTTVLGPVTVIPKEYIHISCRSIDIDIEAPGWENSPKEKLSGQLLDALLTESFDPSEVITAFRGDYRWMPVFEPMRLEIPGKKSPLLRQEGVYLITGGLGGIGSLLAEYLAKTVQAKLILTGRSAFPPADRWDHHLSTVDKDDPVSRNIRKVKELEKKGSEVLVLSADTADEKQMQDAVTRAIERFGRINGVIHAAGLPDGEMIQRRTRETSGRILLPKINGTLVLDKILETLEPDFFIILSSISSLLPALGQVAYCAANTFVDSFAHHKRSKRGFHIVSINWDRWQQVGIAVIAEEMHKKVTGEESEGGITAEEGIETFRRILENPHPQVVVSTSDLNRMIRESHAFKPSSITKGIENITDAETVFKRPELDTQYAIPVNYIEVTLTDIWAKFFGFDRVGIHDDFFELGGDSLKSIIVAAKIHKELNVEVPIQEFFNRPTIEKLAEYIACGTETTTHVSIEPTEKKEYYPLSPTQKRLYILQMMDVNSLSYNISLILELEGKIKRDEIKETFKKLIERHESLRISIEAVGKEPVQRIHDHVEFEIEFYELNSSLPPADNNVSSMIDRTFEAFISPFDLSRAPLLKVGLIRVEETNYILMVHMHHIITDRISQGILSKEFSALRAGEELPALKLQYKDYSEWQRNRATSAAFKRQEEYWLNQFEGEISVLNITTDYPRSQVKSFAGEIIETYLGEEETRGVEELSRSEGATLFMVLLAVYYILLSKLSHQEDIVVGTTVAGRRHSDLEEIIGAFLNTIALRNYPSGEKTFTGFLKEVKKNTLEAFENQDYQFEDIVQKVVLNRDPSRNPLFDVMFDFNPEDADVELEEKDSQYEIKNVKYEIRGSMVDLILYTHPVNGRILFLIQYCIKFYKKETVQTFLEHYERILKQVIKNKEIKIGDIELMDEEEKFIVHSEIQREKKEINVEFDI